MTLTSGALSLIKTRQTPPNERHIMLILFFLGMGIAGVLFFAQVAKTVWGVTNGPPSRDQGVIDNRQRRDK